VDLIILGGSTNQLGGLEAFCERSAAALRRRDSSWQVRQLTTETAYLRIRRLPVMLGQVGLLVWRSRRKPDVVWVQYGNLPDLAFVLLAKLLGMRVMITPHLGANWRSQRSAILRWLSRSLVGLADRIALLSDTQRAEIALPEGRPTTVIGSVLPAYILEAGPAPDVTDNQLHLVHAARLSAGKGTFLVIEVARQLRAAGLPFRLEIAGSGDADTLSRLDALIGGYDLAEHVVLKAAWMGQRCLPP
jgi:glycosyltransferase involved in cell wall biosynthesis